MREILFRGRTKNRKCPAWIEGSLVRGVAKYDGGSVAFIYELSTEIDGRGWIGNYYGEEIIAETVGQWTGMTDKNGVKIFEGDIISINGSYKYSGVGLELVYSKDFMFECINRIHPNFKRYHHRLENIPEKYEVIGNIWDNPELMECEVKE